MILNKIIFIIFILTILIYFSFETQFDDSSQMNKVLQYYCKILKIKPNFIVVQNLQTDNFYAKNNKTQVKSKHNECKYIYFQNTTFFKLKNKLEFITKDQYKKFQMVFDFTHFQSLTFAIFNLLLSVLSKLNEKKFNYLPFIILFDKTPKILYQWASALMSKFANFKCIIIFFKNVQNAMYIRPILDGCAQYESIFVPKTKHDFSRLNNNIERCNLNGAVLNVSVNYVSKSMRFKNKNNNFYLLQLII